MIATGAAESAGRAGDIASSRASVAGLGAECLLSARH